MSSVTQSVSLLIRGIGFTCGAANQPGWRGFKEALSVSVDVCHQRVNTTSLLSVWWKCVFERKAGKSYLEFTFEGVAFSFLPFQLPALLCFCFGLVWFGLGPIVSVGREFW